MAKGMPDDPEDGWKWLAKGIRKLLEIKALSVQDCDAEDTHTFLEACKTAYWLEVNAHLFNKNVQGELNKLYFESK